MPDLYISYVSNIIQARGYVLDDGHGDYNRSYEEDYDDFDYADYSTDHKDNNFRNYEKKKRRKNEDILRRILTRWD